MVLSRGLQHFGARLGTRQQVERLGAPGNVNMGGGGR